MDTLRNPDGDDIVTYREKCELAADGYQTVLDALIAQEETMEAEPSDDPTLIDADEDAFWRQPIKDDILGYADGFPIRFKHFEGFEGFEGKKKIESPTVDHDSITPPRGMNRLANLSEGLIANGIRSIIRDLKSESITRENKRRRTEWIRRMRQIMLRRKER